MGYGRLTCRLAAGATVLLVSGVVFHCHALEWVQRSWSLDDALAVEISEIELTNVDLGTALKVLDNECGLLFGLVGEADEPGVHSVVTLSLRDTTLREVLREIEQMCPTWAFERREGVLLVTPRGNSPVLLALREHKLDRFDLAESPPSQAKASLRRMIGDISFFRSKRLPFLTPEDFPRPRATVALKDSDALSVLCAVAGAIQQSWLLMPETQNSRAVMAIGRAWGLPVGAAFKVRVSPDAAKEPIPDELPPADTVKAAFAEALKGAVAESADPKRAARGLADLIGDAWVRRTASCEQVSDAIRLIGEFRVDGTAAVLARNIDYPPYGEETAEEIMKRELVRRYGTPNEGYSPAQVSEVFRVWLARYPAVSALSEFGKDGLTDLLHVITTHAVTPIPASLTGSTTPADMRLKAHLLDAALVLMLEPDSDFSAADVDVAADLLETAGRDEKDKDRADALQTAAARLRGGLMPSLR